MKYQLWQIFRNRHRPSPVYFALRSILQLIGFSFCILLTNFINSQSILGLPTPTKIAATSTEELVFEYGAPDTKIWREASGYPVDLWVAIGYQPLHISDNPALAQALQVFVGSPEAVDMMRIGKTTVIHSAELSENQSSRREIQISQDSVSTTLDLSYLGSDYDLHLYDHNGNHVGQNYDTGEVDFNISNVIYSGANARPEWITIHGHNEEDFVIEVVAVQAEAPEKFVVIARESPHYPALLGANAIQLIITPETTGEIESYFDIFEYGNQNGVRNVSAAISPLKNELGESIPIDTFQIDVPNSLSPGEQGIGKVTFSGYPIHPGLYTGQINLKAVDVVTGFAVKSTVLFRLQVIDRIITNQTNISTTPPVVRPGGGSSGFLIVLAVLVAGGAGAYIVSKQNQQKKRVLSNAQLVLANGQTYQLHDNFSIGRGSANHLQISEEGVSRNHALIRIAEGKWFLQDLDSLGGTYINGSMVTATALNQGDQIQIGNTTIVFQKA